MFRIRLSFPELSFPKNYFWKREPNSGTQSRILNILKGKSAPNNSCIRCKCKTFCFLTRLRAFTDPRDQSYPSRKTTFSKRSRILNIVKPKCEEDKVQGRVGKREPNSGTQLKPFDEQRDKSSDKQPHTKKDKDKLIKKYTQHLIFIF